MKTTNVPYEEFRVIQLACLVQRKPLAIVMTGGAEFGIVHLTETRIIEDITADNAGTEIQGIELPEHVKVTLIIKKITLSATNV